MFLYFFSSFVTSLNFMSNISAPEIKSSACISFLCIPPKNLTDYFCFILIDSLRTLCSKSTVFLTKREISLSVDTWQYATMFISILSFLFGLLYFVTAVILKIGYYNIEIQQCLKTLHNQYILFFPAFSTDFEYINFSKSLCNTNFSISLRLNFIFNKL